LIENGIVIQSDRTGDAPEGFVEAPDHVVPGYLFVGSEFAAPVPSPPTLDDFKAAIVAYLDAAVQLRGYDSIPLPRRIGMTRTSSIPRKAGQRSVSARECGPTPMRS
jgi:hypothetical protein